MPDRLFLLGSSTVNGARVDRVLVASTRHMPDLNEDLLPWQWGNDPDNGLAWFWAYEEDAEIDGRSMPEWLLDLCITARQNHGCNWVLLDPEGDNESDWAEEGWPFPEDEDFPGWFATYYHYDAGDTGVECNPYPNAPAPAGE